MFKLLSLLTLSFGLITSSSSYAAEDSIDGAFGFKLGDSYDQKQTIKVIGIENSDTYEVKALQPYVAFNHYYLTVSPKTKKIQTISATGDYESLNTCVSEYKVLLMVLEDKYKSFKDPVAMTDNRYSIGINIGSNSIKTMCQENKDKTATMAISYLTSESTEAPKNEQKAELIKKIDKRGL